MALIAVSRLARRVGARKAADVFDASGCQDVTGVSIKNLVRTLRPLRNVTIEINGHTLTAAPSIGAEAREILDQLPAIDALGH